LPPVARRCLLFGVDYSFPSATTRIPVSRLTVTKLQGHLLILLPRFFQSVTGKIQLQDEPVILRWQPNHDTLVAFASYQLIVVGLLTAFQVFTTERVAANYITFGPITLAGLGVALPAFYTVLVGCRSMAEPRVTTRHLWISLLLCTLLGLVTCRGTLATLTEEEVARAVGESDRDPMTLKRLLAHVHHLSRVAPCLCYNQPAERINP